MKNQLTRFERFKTMYFLGRIIKEPTNTSLVFKYFSSFLTIKDQDMVNLHIEKMYECNLIDLQYELGYTASASLQGFLQKKFPPGSLGQHLRDFFLSNHLDIDFFPDLYSKSPSRANYIVCRAYEAHDLWHVLLGLGVRPIDELGMLAFTAGQLNSTAAMNVAIAGYFHCNKTDGRWDTSIIQYMISAFELGYKAKSLLAARPELRLNEHIVDVRMDLGLPIDGLVAPELIEEFGA